jgi:hypothetical protein
LIHFAWKIRSIFEVRIPPAAARALSRHISQAVKRIDPVRYRQEPAYVAALFGKLDAVVYHDAGLTVELKSTIVGDRGRNSAESKWGADFGLIASISGPTERQEKAVLGQAKRGSLISLAPTDASNFREQALRMSVATEAIVGLEVPETAGALPMIRILEVPMLYGTAPIQRYFRKYVARIQSDNLREPPLLLGEPLQIGRYLYTELIRCMHGDADTNFVHDVEDSSLSSLKIRVQSA